MARRKKASDWDPKAHLAAMDRRLGKTRITHWVRPGTQDIRKGDLVKVSGIGVGEPMRFVDHVTLEDGRQYVTVMDSVRKTRTMAFKAVRPEQVSRVRDQ